jgi:acyl carrier protein
MINNQDIIDKIKVFLAEQLDRGTTSFHEAETFLENGCDEFDFIELMMSVEDNFGITIEEDITAGMTLASLAELIAHEKNKTKK